MSHPECGSDEVSTRLRLAGELFHRFGAAAWPGATHLLLLEVDQVGNMMGGAETICRACIHEASARVLCRLDEIEARDAGRSNLPYLELAGQLGMPDGPCSICGEYP